MWSSNNANSILSKKTCEGPGGGGGHSLIWSIRLRAALDRVWFFGLAVLNRVYNLTCLCPKQVKNLS